MIRARAGAGRSTSSATGSWRKSRRAAAPWGLELFLACSEPRPPDSGTAMFGKALRSSLASTVTSFTSRRLARQMNLQSQAVQPLLRASSSTSNESTSYSCSASSASASR
jgi:hypothetical protein